MTSIKNSNKNRKDSVVFDEEKIKMNEMKKELDNLKLDKMEMEAELIQIKMEKRDAVSMVNNLSGLEVLRAEMAEADMFLKMMSKDNLLGSKEVYDDNTEVTKETKIKKYKLKDTSSMMYTCKCNACFLMKSNPQMEKSKYLDSVTKHVMLSHSMMMSIEYSPNDYYYENQIANDSNKIVKLTGKDSSKKTVQMNFVSKKNKNKDMKDFNFGNNRCIKVSKEGDMVSFSSMLVVEAMRTMNRVNQAKEIEIINNVTLKDGINDCFYLTMKNFIPNLLLREKLMYINDLTPEEEMIFLTNCHDKKIFIKQEVNKSLKNHMSHLPFDECTEVWAASLVTPMFRDIMFFSSEDYISLTMSDNNTDSTSEDNNSFPRVLFDRFEPSRFKGNYDMLEMTEIKACNLDMSKLLRELHEKEVSTNLLSVYGNSELMKIIDKNSHFKFSMIKLRYMTFQEFQAIAYFCPNNEKLTELVYMDKLTTWVQMYGTLTKMIMYMYWRTNENPEKDLESKLAEFYSSLMKMSDLNSNIMHKQYQFLMERIVQYLFMSNLGTFLDKYKLDNREYFETLVDRTDSFDTAERFRLEMTKDMALSNEFSIFKINNFPKIFNSEFKKMLDESQYYEMMDKLRMDYVVGENADLFNCLST